MYWDSQFAETRSDRNARLRKAVLAARCQKCGGNSKLGRPHAADCPSAPKQEATAIPPQTGE